MRTVYMLTYLLVIIVCVMIFIEILLFINTANCLLKKTLKHYFVKYLTQDMPFAPELRTHSQKVCTLYKKAMRMIEAYYGARTLVRYHQVILRHEFDKNKCVCEPKEMRRLLWLGEYEIFSKQHAIPVMKFPRSYGLAGGVAAERTVVIPDWVLDYWHPLEKAQYPSYFEKREQRKCEYIKKWHSGELY